VQKNTNSCRARKGDLQCAFPLDVLIVYLPKLSFVANGNNLTSIGLAPGKTTCFRSLEFIADRLGRILLSALEGYSGTIFIGWCTVGNHLYTPPSWIPRAKGELRVPQPLRVQCGNPDCPHRHHTGIGKHSITPDHPDGHGADRCTTTRYGAPPQPPAGLP
jgi:hypothetical protein